MMQKVTNLEMLKLSHWNPARSMVEVITTIRDFLQHTCRLEVEAERNNAHTYPAGAYFPIENLLLRLAMVSVTNVTQVIVMSHSDESQ